MAVLQGDGRGRVGNFSEHRGLGEGLPRPHQADNVFFALRGTLDQFYLAGDEQIKPLGLFPLPKNGGLPGEGFLYRHAGQGLQVRLGNPGKQINAP